MSARRAGLTAVLGVVAGLVVLLGLVTWAASVGPHDVVTGKATDPSILVPTQEGAAPAITRTGSAENPFHRKPVTPYSLWWWLVLTTRVVVYGALAYVLLRLVLWAGGSVRARRRRRPVYVAADFDVLEAPAAVAEALTEDADEQLARLLQGLPRNEIVACWDHFEAQAGLVGASRKPWETSSEFTLRILDRVGADPVAVSELEGLYREARFSEHPMGEDARQRAVDALQRIHGSLRATAAGSR